MPPLGALTQAWTAAEAALASAGESAASTASMTPGSPLGKALALTTTSAARGGSPNRRCCG